ncbi:hypothetical protein FHS57_002858 [Runella defluvii]|uniref:Uncharacterized protein n=1 Tax=Runella defluvii TaxID=370973 RepID=A0A7W5ZK78_9BACT|nr:hypothetical protein [Runella defluvii]
MLIFFYETLSFPIPLKIKTPRVYYERSLPLGWSEYCYII